MTVGALFAPRTSIPIVGKFAIAFLALAFLLFRLLSPLKRWIKSDPRAPAWDEIQSVPPIEPEPPFKGDGFIGRAIADRVAKWTLNRKNKDEFYLNAMGEMFDIGTKYTPKNPVEAMRWYKVAVGGGDPAKANGPHYAKLRIAEMYEDGEGAPRNLDEATRIYKTLPHYPSARLHFAIAYVEGRGVPQDYTEAYKLLLLADKFYCWHAPSRRQVEANPQSHRENRRHIRIRELMTTLETHLDPKRLMKAREAAREWWNAHR